MSPADFKPIIKKGGGEVVTGYRLDISDPVFPKIRLVKFLRGIEAEPGSKYYIHFTQAKRALIDYVDQTLEHWKYLKREARSLSKQKIDLEQKSILEQAE